jgi:tetratricopeptide (TPR) repeat protein
MFLEVRLQRTFATAVCLGLAFSVGSCDRMINPRNAQVIKDAESKTADGNYLRAITLYESALDGSAKSADIHYRLALLYDDKMHDPLNALHHFKRYLTLAPSGPHANEVKNFMKKDELELGTSLSGDSVVSRAEAGSPRENRALMSFGMATRWLRSRESFISHPVVGKRFATPTAASSMIRES